MSTNISFK